MVFAAYVRLSQTDNITNVLNVLTLFALTADAGKLFHIFIIRLKMKTFLDDNDVSS